MKKFGHKVNKFGFNFAVCDPSGIILQCDGGRFCSDPGWLAECSQRTFQQAQGCLAAQGGQTRSLDTQLVESGSRHYWYSNQTVAVSLSSADEVVAVALVDLGHENIGDNEDLRRLCCQQGIDYKLFADMVKTPLQRDREYLAEILTTLANNFQDTAKTAKQVEIVSTELAQVYEELVLLYKMSTNMKVTQPDSNYLQMACDSLTDLVNVEGISILAERNVNNEKRLVLMAGAGLIDIDEQTAAILYSRLDKEINSGKEALLDSDVDSPFKYDWPDRIRNIIAVPLYGSEGSDFAGVSDADVVVSGSCEGQENAVCPRIVGLMVAVNRIDKPDFDSIDVKLFNSVASQCATFIENGRLFRDIKELFIGSLKALTNSIDAKDQYTRGHSERVALISRWIAERLAEQEPLEEEQIHKIYLVGLLHDIGKIGVDEIALRKQGALTEQERIQIKSHPSIGANILSQIRQMSDIVPGVLCHHERPDGKGYPRGLSGQQIPLMGRIVMLADCFDAMTSKRAYRNALSIEQALAEIERGLGTQFDEKLGRIFIQSDVHQLWDTIKEGFVENFTQGDFFDYGTVAVETLIL